jgi:hypothetical protein
MNLLPLLLMYLWSQSQQGGGPSADSVNARWERLYAQRSKLPATFADDYVQAHAFYMKTKDVHPSVDVPSGVQKWSTVAAQYERLL